MHDNIGHTFLVLQECEVSMANDIHNALAIKGRSDSYLEYINCIAGYMWVE